MTNQFIQELDNRFSLASQDLLKEIYAEQTPAQRQVAMEAHLLKLSEVFSVLIAHHEQCIKSVASIKSAGGSQKALEREFGPNHPYVIEYHKLFN